MLFLTPLSLPFKERGIIQSLMSTFLWQLQNLNNEISEIEPTL